MKNYKYSVKKNLVQMQVPGTRSVPGTRYQVVPGTRPRTRYQLPATSYQTTYQVPATSYQVPGTSYQVPGTQYQQYWQQGPYYCIQQLLPVPGRLVVRHAKNSYSTLVPGTRYSQSILGPTSVQTYYLVPGQTRVGPTGTHEDTLYWLHLYKYLLHTSSIYRAQVLAQGLGIRPRALHTGKLWTCHFCTPPHIGTVCTQYQPGGLIVDITIDF